MTDVTSPIPNTCQNRSVGVVVRFALYISLVIVAFGQPNGLFLYIAAYPNIILGVLACLTVLVGVNKIIGNRWSIPKIDLFIPIILFFGLSIVSLMYAIDVFFGMRVLISMAFKVIFCIILIETCWSFNDLRRLLRCIAFIGGTFAIQSLMLVIAIALFHIQPMGTFGTESVFDAVNYDYNLLSYGLLGTVRTMVDFGGILVPRGQAMFIEPGWFATFLELTIFASLGYRVLQPKGKRGFATALIGLQMLALLFTFSSAGWLVVTLGWGCVWIVIERLRILRAIGHVLRLVLFGVALLILALLIKPSLLAAVYNEVWVQKFSVPWGASSSEIRVQAFQIAVDLFLQRPFFGWGISQMRIITNGIGSNNSFATVAMELGSVGLLLYSLIILAIVRTMVKTVRLAWKSAVPQATGLAGAMVGGMLATLVHSFFVDSNWLFPYWIMVSLLYITVRLLVQAQVDANRLVYASSC